MSGNHHTSTPPRRRLVVFIGPPKTASTSLQEFFARYANGQNAESSSKVAAFANWNYPMFLGSRNGLKEIRFGPSNKAYLSIKEKFQRQPIDLNLVVGSEYLVNFESWKENVFSTFKNWTDDNAVPEVVVQYRSPRMSHLISIWKQQTQVKGKATYGYSFRDWICSGDPSVNVRLGRLANPLGLVEPLVHKYQLPTYLMDMGGIQNQGKDISHVFGCDILRVNCTQDGRWIVGLEGEIIRQNSRKGDPQLSAEQKEQLEHVFTQRDCTYYDELHDHPLLHILYRHQLWKDDCSSVTPEPRFRENVTTMVSRMQQIMQCPGVESLLAGGGAFPATGIVASTKSSLNASLVPPRKNISVSVDNLPKSTLLNNTTSSASSWNNLNTSFLITRTQHTGSVVALGPSNNPVSLMSYAVLLLFAAAYRYYRRKASRAQ
jgi:hypothetical protein